MVPTAKKPTILPAHLRVYLIKPSQYDDDGVVIRFLRGVLPSNTLACLNGLTKGIQQEALLGDIKIEIEMLDETVDRIRPDKLGKKAAVQERKEGIKSMFCLVGVQSAQFIRASDIAHTLAQCGQTVLIGGFHISGTIATFGKPTPELEQLIDNGISLVAGEVEESWGKILRDVLENRVKPFYDFLKAKPELYTPYLPVQEKPYLKKFALREFGTLDCGRGCPFSCSFCTIINVHGQKMRCRSTDHLEEHFRTNYFKNGIKFYFFTDDNFSRNKNWPAIFLILERLRQEGLDITFMMQIDVRAYKIDRFVNSAIAAGCVQVFLGMESVNKQNLEWAGKSHNRVEDYAAMVSHWRERGVKTHVGYIIGFPFDTPESVANDVKTLAQDIGVEIASFFILTPLPGSTDHLNLVKSGTPFEDDLNKFDSFHVVADHPKMSKQQWEKAYRQAWKYFYSSQRIAGVLRGLKGKRFFSMLGTFAWYKYAIIVNKLHPMVSGFHRIKSRGDFRPGILRPTWLRFYGRRIWEITVELTLTAQIGLMALFMIMRFPLNWREARV